MKPDQSNATATFTAGSGTRYGLVSLPGSAEVVVFMQHDDGVWRGRAQFGPSDSTGLVPGVAIPEITAAFDEERS